MKALKDFKGSYNSAQQSIMFTWDARALGTDGCIVIIALTGEGSSVQLDFSCYKVMDVRTLPGNGNTYNLKVALGRAGVYKMMFCGVCAPSSADVRDDAVLEICKTVPESIASVMMGKAEIVWSASTSVQDQYKLVTMEITSNCEIAPGVLGYQYQFGPELIVRMPFPGPIHRGTQGGYGPILIPRDAEIAVAPYDTQFNGNFDIRYKKRLFGF